MYLSDVGALRATRGGATLRSGWLRPHAHTQVRGRAVRTRRYLVPRSDQVGDLALSLKPPRFVRKIGSAIKRNVTLKRVLVGTAIVAGAVIAAPIAAAAARKLVPLAVKGVGTGFRTLTNAGRGIAQRVGLPTTNAPTMAPPITDRERAGFPEPEGGTTNTAPPQQSPGWPQSPTAAQLPPAGTVYGPPAPAPPAPQVYGPPAPGSGEQVAQPPAPSVGPQMDAAASEAPSMPSWLLPVGIVAGLALLAHGQRGH